ncbi:hypothetical protein GIB67_002305, partial [Kingdonia uniflora]
MRTEKKSKEMGHESTSNDLLEFEHKPDFMSSSLGKVVFQDDGSLTKLRIEELSSSSLSVSSAARAKLDFKLVRVSWYQSDLVAMAEGPNATDPAQVLAQQVGGPSVNPRPLNTRTRLDQLEDKMQALSGIIDQVTTLEERLDGFSDDQAHVGKRLVTLEGVVEGNMATLLDQSSSQSQQRAGSSNNYNKGKNGGYQARSGGDQGHGQNRSGGASAGVSSAARAKLDFKLVRVNDEAFEEEEMVEFEDESDDLIESDLEVLGEDIVEPDNDPPQKVFVIGLQMLMWMGDPFVEVTNESQDESQMAKSFAMEALAEGELEKAIEHLTVAILLNLTSAIMYETRASVYIKMMKLNAAIRDANAALEDFSIPNFSFYLKVSHPIHDQTFYLSSDHKKKLKEFGVELWTFAQKLSEAVFIPAGCPHQVRNLMVFLGLAEKDMKLINALFRELEVVKNRIEDCKSQEEVESLKFTQKKIINK